VPLNYAPPPIRWRRRRFLDARAARRLTLLLACAGGLAVCPASALADTSTSANWSGYVAHRAGVSFRRVQASWTQPNASCQRGDPTYSAFWVGIGGYSRNSDALEQIGTGLDCSASGTITSSAWYELVPAPMNGIRMTVKPGDLMSASVVVAGHLVTLRLTNQTQHESFSKQVTANSVDTSAADWIAEAPSACATTNFCEPLPLTNFGSTSFTAARARTTTGFDGPIASSAWDTTKIVLSSGGRMFIGYGPASQSSPSALLRSGTSFQVSYSQSDAAPSPPSFYSHSRLPGHPNDAVQPGGKRR
jgi:Peptidase A4 family